MLHRFYESYWSHKPGLHEEYLHDVGRKDAERWSRPNSRAWEKLSLALTQELCGGCEGTIWDTYRRVVVVLVTFRSEHQLSKLV